MIPRSRVLIVDDELGVRESLRAILSGDHDVLTACNGDEALAIVEHEPIDLMTLDLKMPGLSGMRVLERVKQIDPDIEVLIITGYGSFDTAIEGLRFHAFDYLAKPFDTEHVRRLVQKALARRAATQRIKTVPQQLLSTLSHELRTPLNVIMGYSNMLQEDGIDPEEQRRVLDRIQENSTSLLGYVEMLFYLAELQRGERPLTVTAVRVDEVLARVAKEYEGAARAKDLTLRLESESDIVLTSDEDKLERLVRALVDNAVKFTPAGEVVLRAASAAAGASLEVRDTGPGLTDDVIAETQDEISGASEQRPGRVLGFGLRLAGRLIRVFRGTLEVAAGPTGTTWRIALPHLVADAVEAAPQPQSIPA